MAGMQCADFDAKGLGTQLCLLTSGPYAGLVTYPDGRVAAATADSSDGANGELTFAASRGSGFVKIGSLSVDTVRLARELSGAEIGNCSAQGPMSSGVYASLPNLFRNAPIAWSVGDLKALQHALGQAAPTASGNAFFCADDAHAGEIVVNVAMPNMTRVKAAIANLESSCGALDAVHCEAASEGLRAAIGMGPRETMWDQVKKTAEYTLGGLAVFVLGGLGSHVLSKWWDNRGGPPTGGGGAQNGGQGGTPAPEVRTAAPEAASEDAQTNAAERRTYIVEAVGDGDGAGVRIITGDFEPAAPEPARAPVRAGARPDASHEFQPFPYLLGALVVGALIVCTDGAAAPEAETALEWAVEIF